MESLKLRQGQRQWGAPEDRCHIPDLLSAADAPHGADRYGRRSLHLHVLPHGCSCSSRGGHRNPHYKLRPIGSRCHDRAAGLVWAQQWTALAARPPLCLQHPSSPQPPPEAPGATRTDQQQQPRTGHESYYSVRPSLRLNLCMQRIYRKDSLRRIKLCFLRTQCSAVRV